MKEHEHGKPSMHGEGEDPKFGKPKRDSAAHASHHEWNKKHGTHGGITGAPEHDEYGGDGKIGNECNEECID